MVYVVKQRLMEKKYVKGFGEIRIIDLKKKIRYAAPNVIIDDNIKWKI